MITINLLPIEYFKKRAQGRNFLVVLTLAVAISLAVSLVVQHLFMGPDLARRAQDAAARQAELAALQVEVTEADAATKATVRLWQQLVAIANLEERRRDQTRLLVELDEILPRSNAWLVSFDNTQGIVSIGGIATDKDTVSEFLVKLKKSRHLNNLYLVDIAQNEIINKIRLTRFRIKGNAVFSQPALIHNGLPKSGLPSYQTFVDAVAIAAPGLAQTLQKPGANSSRSPL